jgi:Flp pilus assembly protein TadD
MGLARVAGKPFFLGVLMRSIAYLVVFMCFLVPLISAQQKTTASIVGSLRVGNGDLPSRRILVTLETRGATIASTYAEDEGGFSFNDLPPNIYHVIINEPDFEPVRVDAVINPLILNNVFIQIQLTAKTHSADAGNGQSRKGSNPYMVDASDYAKQYPKEAVNEFKKGLEATSKEKIDDAIKHFKKAVEIAPSFYPAQNNLGSAYLSEKKFEEASQCFEQVIQANQADAAAYFNLANVYLLTNRLQQALATATEGMKREPSSGTGQFVLGAIYQRLGRFQQAEDTLRNALRADPTLGKVHLELVNLYLSRKDIPAAVHELQVFIAAYPEDPMVDHAKQVLQKLQK